MELYETERVYNQIALAKSGDASAKAQLVEEHMRLVYRIASRFYGRGIEKEDLHQLGAIGLLSAIEKFDRSKGTRFSTYAVPVIVGEIKRHFRDDGAIKVSRTLKTLAAHAARLTEQIRAEQDRIPTVSELATQLGVSKEELAQATEALSPVRSLSEPLGDDKTTLAETLPAPDVCPMLLERLDIQTAVQTLPEREQHILYLRFFGEKTQADIAKKLGISQVQVSRLEKKIFTQLKNQLK